MNKPTYDELRDAFGSLAAGFGDDDTGLAATEARAMMARFRDPNDEAWEHVAMALHTMRDQSDRLSVAYEAIGLQSDSVLCDAQGRMEQVVIDGLELLVGDEFGMISWYVYENNYGRAGVTFNMRKIKGIGQLRKLIEDRNS